MLRLQAVGVYSSQRFAVAVGAGAPQVFQRITQGGALFRGQAIHLQHHVVVIAHLFQPVGWVSFLILGHAYPLQLAGVRPFLLFQPSAYAL